MSRQHVPYGRVLILAIGAVWTTVLALDDGTVVMWPIVAWLWLSVFSAAGRPLRRARQPAGETPEGPAVRGLADTWVSPVFRANAKSRHR